MRVIYGEKILMGNTFVLGIRIKIVYVLKAHQYSMQEFNTVVQMGTGERVFLRK